MVGTHGAPVPQTDHGHCFAPVTGNSWRKTAAATAPRASGLRAGRPCTAGSEPSRSEPLSGAGVKGKGQGLGGGARWGGEGGGGAGAGGGGGGRGGAPSCCPKWSALRSSSAARSARAAATFAAISARRLSTSPPASPIPPPPAPRAPCQTLEPGPLPPAPPVERIGIKSSEEKPSRKGPGPPLPPHRGRGAWVRGGRGGGGGGGGPEPERSLGGGRWVEWVEGFKLPIAH